jgi:hypothetical protein
MRTILALAVFLWIAATTHASFFPCSADDWTTVRASAPSALPHPLRLLQLTSPCIDNKRSTSYAWKSPRVCHCDPASCALPSTVNDLPCGPPPRPPLAADWALWQIVWQMTTLPTRRNVLTQATAQQGLIRSNRIVSVAEELLRHPRE